MSEKLAPNHLGTLDELALSTLWETSALVELLARTGILPKQDVLAMIQELRQREPPAIPPRGVSSSYIAVPPLPASLSQGRSSPVVYFLCPVEQMCVSVSSIGQATTERVPPDSRRGVLWSAVVSSAFRFNAPLRS